MKSPFFYSNDNKRYHTLSYHLKRKFSVRVFKAVIDAGFTCPNIDGTKGFGGCTYCLGGSGEFTHGADLGIKEQICREIERIHIKHPNAKVIAYFQAHTNTYAPFEKLKNIYETALSADGVCGISIATRADAIDTKTMDYLSELSKKTYLTVELGLQTVHDETAEKINRGHTYSDFLKTYRELKLRGIRVCIHIINGLPGETDDMMIKTAYEIGKLKADAVKIHLLQIMQGTVMEKQYKAGLIIPMTKENYIDVVCSQLEVLSPETVIERITGDGSHDKLIAPKWGINKIAVLGSIDKALVQKDTWQGKLYKC